MNIGAAPAGTMMSQSAGPYDPRLLQQQMEFAELMAPYGPREKEIERQQAYADQLRDTKAPEMRGNARIQTAANPLEFLGASAQRTVGRMKGDEASGGRKRMVDDLVDELRRRRMGDSGGGNISSFMPELPNVPELPGIG